jgi:plastocyanin
MCIQLFRLSLLISLVTIVSSAVSRHAAADEAWGTIKGRIVYSENAPTAEKIDVERDAEVCGIVGLVDESLVVHKENRGIRSVAVWLETREEIPVHPDLQQPPKEAPYIDNRDCRFEPRMLAVRTGQVFELKNSDPVAHNAAVYARRNTPFSEIIPMNQPLQKKFAKVETLPVRVDCSIHAWMKAWLIVADHPYVAVTGKDGSFEIKHVPAGEWKFRFWHERPGYVQSLVTDGKPAPLEKGNWVLTITADKTLDLGDLIAPAQQFVVKK